MRVLSGLGRFFSALMEHGIMNLPHDNLSSRLRFRLLRKKLKHTSGYFYSDTGLSIAGHNHIEIGHGCFISHGVVIRSSGGCEIKIGNNVLIGPYVVIRSQNHQYDNPNILIKNQGHKGGQIIIEDDCWLASHVTVTSGCKIGKGSVIGANSVVTKNIAPYSVAFGSPAKFIRKRGTK